MPGLPKWPLRVVQFRTGTNFDNAVRSLDRLTRVAPNADMGLDAVVYAIPPEARPPGWASLVEAMSGGPLPVLENQFSGAIILAWFDGRLWGLTFGLGHLYLADDRLENRFGLRTVLNLVDPNRLLSVGSRVHDDLIMRTLRQASRSTGRTTFAIDATRDIVGAVVGAPRDKNTWGPRLSGSAAISLTVPFVATSLADLLERLLAAHNAETYKEEFGFIDFIEAVRDPDLQERLDANVLAAVRGEFTSDVYLAPPDIIDYEDVGGFLFTGERLGNEHPELDLEDFRRLVDPDGLTLADLQTRSVRLISESTGSELKRWSIYRCLVHETTDNGRTYLLSEGEWWSVDDDFVGRVNLGIAAISDASYLGLPPARPGETEGDWNIRAAAQCGFALLDKQNVRFGGTAMEVCDIFAPTGELIHAKRKTESATLSHLMNQGRVSAEALKVDAGVRAAAAQLLTTRGSAGAGLIHPGPFTPSRHTVVYAVIAKNAADLPGKLPFFSRLNLWHATRFLEATLDYKVAFVGIPV